MILKATLVVIAFLSFALIAVFIFMYYRGEKQDIKMIDRKIELLKKIKDMRQEDFDSLIEEQMRHPVVNNFSNQSVNGNVTPIIINGAFNQKEGTPLKKDEATLEQNQPLTEGMQNAQPQNIVIAPSLMDQKQNAVISPVVPNDVKETVAEEAPVAPQTPVVNEEQPVEQTEVVEKPVEHVLEEQHEQVNNEVREETVTPSYETKEQEQVVHEEKEEVKESEVTSSVKEEVKEQPAIIKEEREIDPKRYAPIEFEDFEEESNEEDAEEVEEESIEDIKNEIEETKEEEPVNEKKPILVPNNTKYEHKTCTVLLYNNIGSNALLLLDYEKGVLKNRFDIDITGFNLEDGLIANIEGLASKIHELIPSIKSLEILLSVEQCFRNVVSLPKMSRGKAEKLYNKEIKDDFPKYNEKYFTFKHTYDHKLGTVFYTYFVPNYIGTYFKKLAKLLNTHLGAVDLWGNYLFNNVNSTIKDDFILIYVYNNLATLVNSFDGKLVAFHSFKCESEQDIITECLANVAKHEFELEKRLIKNYIYISNKDYDISSLTKDLNEFAYKIDLDHYHVKGIRL